MDKTLIVNAMIFDGSGAAPFSGEVLVERIEERQHERPPAAEATGLGVVISLPLSITCGPRC